MTERFSTRDTHIKLCFVWLHNLHESFVGVTSSSLSFRDGGIRILFMLAMTVWLSLIVALLSIHQPDSLM